MNFLTEQERAQLRLQHKQERDKRVCDRNYGMSNERCLDEMEERVDESVPF